jgi:hypothetical protein
MEVSPSFAKVEAKSIALFELLKRIYSESGSLGSSGQAVKVKQMVNAKNISLFVSFIIYKSCTYGVGFSLQLESIKTIINNFLMDN